MPRPQLLPHHDPPPSLASPTAKRLSASSGPLQRVKDETHHRKAVPSAFLNAVARVQTQARTSLRLALSCERAMRWREVTGFLSCSCAEGGQEGWNGARTECELEQEGLCPLQEFDRIFAVSKGLGCKLE